MEIAGLLLLENFKSNIFSTIEADIFLVVFLNNFWFCCRGY